jgi:hypothetical protein
MVAKLTSLPRTLLIAGVLVIAPALAFAQTTPATPAAAASQPAPTAKPEAPVTAAVAPAKSEVAATPEAAAKSETAVKPVKPAAHVHSKRVDPKLAPVGAKVTAPAEPVMPKS